MNAKRILLVDDDDIILKVIKRQLSRKMNYVVEVANDGEESLKMVEGFKPDVIVLDIEMPRMDGHETCQQLREQNEYRDLPIIFLTGNSSEWNVLNGYSNGCDNYLTKPLDMNDVFYEKLIASIEDLSEHKNRGFRSTVSFN